MHLGGKFENFLKDMKVAFKHIVEATYIRQFYLACKRSLTKVTLSILLKGKPKK